MNNRDSLTMLGIVKNYIEKEKISSKSFVIPKDLFDNAFNEVILDQLSHSFNEEKFGIPQIYEIKLDENNNPYFYVISDSGNKFAVLMTGIEYSNIKGKKITETNFMYTLEDYIGYFANKSRLLHGTNWLGNNDHHGIQQRFANYGYNICLYIQNVLAKNERIKTIRQISYDKHESELYIPDSDYVPNKKEGISLDTRLQILRSKNVTLETTGIKSTSEEISYYLFLYNNVCSGATLIMEPLKGYKSTRCIYLNNPITVKRLPSIASYYLSLNYNELLREQAVSIHKHSTPNKFNSLVSYVTGDRTSTIPFYVKDRIDMAIEEGRTNKGLH